MILPKSLQEENFSYSSEKTKPDLIEDIKKMFSGKFFSDNEFYVNSKSAMFFEDSGSGGHNSLKGKITANGEKVTIDIVVKPVPRIYISTFVPPLVGLVYLFHIIFYSGSIELAPLLYSIALIILIPLLMLFLGQASKDKLRKRFVNILNLSKI